MKTRYKILIIIGIIIIGIFIFTTVSNIKLSDIGSILFRQIPLMIQNNPINHSHIVADIKKTPEYQKFNSTFPIYDERIILTHGNSLQYQVISIDDKTKKFLILYFNHYNNGRLNAHIYCSVDTPLDDSNRMPDGTVNREKILRYVEITDCVETYEK